MASTVTETSSLFPRETKDIGNSFITMLSLRQETDSTPRNSISIVRLRLLSVVSMEETKFAKITLMVIVEILPAEATMLTSNSLAGGDNLNTRMNKSSKNQMVKSLKLPLDQIKRVLMCTQLQIMDRFNKNGKSFMLTEQSKSQQADSMSNSDSMSTDHSI